MRILSFGEIIWDVYPDQSCIGGAPLNFAAHTVKSGAEAYLLSAVGEDALGREAMERLARFGVRSDFVSTVKGKPTGQCLVTLNAARVPTYEILRDVAYDYVPLPDAVLSKSFDALCFGTLALREARNRAMLKRLLDAGICKTVYCDLNLRTPFYGAETVKLCLSSAHILKLSETELEYVSAQVLRQVFTSYEESLRALAARYSNLQLILLTCGEDGAYAYSRKTEQLYYEPAQKVEVVSTVGAGDSFGAAFLVDYLRGESLPACLKGAAERSAYVVAHAEAIPD